MIEVVLFYSALFEVLNVFSCFNITLELINVIFDVLRFMSNGEIKDSTIIPEIECINTITHSCFIHYFILQTHYKIILRCWLKNQCPWSLYE